MKNSTFQSQIDNLKANSSCIDYAQYSLNLPIAQPGDRCTSPFPGSHHTDNAFVCFHDYWFDFSAQKGGDIIELSRWLMHNGNRTEALREFGIISDKLDEISRHDSQLRLKIDFWHSQLRPQDFDYLHSRRINDDTISKLKIGYSEKRKRLIIPYFRNGEPVYWAGRDRSEPPYPDGKKPSKYFKMSLGEFYENIPWGLDTLGPKDTSPVHTPSGSVIKDDYLVISEGMFDILSFWQEGYRCLSPIGGFFNKKLHKMIIDICRNVKRVFLCFDSDGAGQGFTRSMARLLFANRIKFVCGILPKGIKDVSDYYADGGSLDELVAGAENGLRILARSFTDEDDFKAFMFDAARFTDKSDLMLMCKQAVNLDSDFVETVRKEALKGPGETMTVERIISQYDLKYINGMGFYEYENGVWNLKSDWFIKNYIREELGIYAKNSKLIAVCGMLKSSCISESEFNKQFIVNFPNGILDLKTFQLIPHNKNFLSSIQMTYDYDPEAKAPLWEKFIHEVMSNDEDKIRLIQEMCGYVLFPNCCLQKAFILKGKGANGKSVFLSVLRALFNPENCTSIEISHLAKPFMAIHLKDALVNLCSEITSNIVGAEAMFRKIVSGDDGIYDSFKGQDGITFRPRCKQFISINEYFMTKEINFALGRRLLFVEFKETFDGKKADPGLEEKLKQELPGIFNWVFEGYKRLIQNMAFSVTREHERIMKDFLETVNPVVTFITEEFMEVSDTQTAAREIYTKYVSWCKESGSMPLKRKTFIERFNSTIQQYRPDAYTKRIHGQNVWYFPAVRIDFDIHEEDMNNGR